MTALRRAALAAGLIATVGIGAMALAVSRLSPSVGAARPGTDGATYAGVSGQPGRFVVTSLRTGGAEASAGLRVGDMVETIDGAAATPGAIAREVARPGSTVVRVRRHGDVIRLTL